MATSSFDKSFVVTDKESANKLREELAKKNVIKVKKTNLEKNSEKGLKLLKELYSV